MHGLPLSVRSLFVGDDGALSLELLSGMLPRLQRVSFTDITADILRERISEYIECIENTNKLKRFEIRSTLEKNGHADISILSLIDETKDRFCEMGRTLHYVFGKDHCHRIVSEKYEIFSFRDKRMNYTFDGPLLITESFSVPSTEGLDILAAGDVVIQAPAAVMAVPLSAADIALLNQKGETNEDDDYIGLDVAVRMKQKKYFMKNAGGKQLEFGEGTVISSICVRTSGMMKNYGNLCIDSSQNEEYQGVVVIEAGGFLNEGTVSPEPTIIISSEIYSDLSDVDARERTISDEKEQLIDMEYYDHRGHEDDKDYAHPKNLLSDGDNKLDDDNKMYSSIPGVTRGDLMMFKLNRYQIPMKPTFLKIKNWGDKEGIKDIRIWIGCDNGKWIKLCDDVHIEIGEEDQETNGWKEQKINLNLRLSDEEIVENEADILLIEILRNYGDDKYNAFVSFKVFGRGINGSE